MSSDSAPGPTKSRTGSSTYLILALTSAGFALLAAPELLAAVGLASERSLQGWMAFVGILLAFPLAILVAAAVILSLVGLLRGPSVLRRRLAAWWAVGAAGLALPRAFAPTPGFNPYLGTPQPTFGVGDAVLTLSLGLCVFLAARWFALSRRRNQTARD